MLQTHTPPRREVAEDKRTILPLLTGASLQVNITVLSLDIRPGAPLTPSKNSSGVFGSLERGLDKMKNMLTPRYITPFNTSTI